MGRVDAHMDGVKGHYFSHECAGIVTKVGSKVNSVKPGDHIMCITSGSYGTVERVEAGACCNVGKHIAFAVRPPTTLMALINNANSFRKWLPYLLYIQLPSMH